MRGVWWLGVLVGCGGGEVVAPPPAPPTPAPTPSVIVPPVDGAACAAPVAHGDEVGVYRGRLGDSNALELHLFKAPAATDGAPSPGLVAWGDLSVGQIDTLLDLDTRLALPDPGAVCVRSVKPGELQADEFTTKLVSLTLRGDLTTEQAAAIWTAPALAPYLDGEHSRLVPGYDPAPPGAAYLLVRLGQTGDHGYPVALEPGKALRGDAVVSLVDDQGRAIYETAAMR